MPSLDCADASQPRPLTPLCVYAADFLRDVSESRQKSRRMFSLRFLEAAGETGREGQRVIGVETVLTVSPGAPTPPRGPSMPASPC